MINNFNIFKINI